VPSTTAPTPGAEVRIDLTPSGSASLVPILGQDTRAVEGRVSSASDSGYVVAVSGTIKHGHGSGGEPTVSRVTWAGESVRIPRFALDHVELRSLDARKTGFVAIFGAVLTVVAVKLITNAIGSSGSSSDGGSVISP
jgi:hypothetical protein